MKFKQLLVAATVGLTAFAAHGQSPSVSKQVAEALTAASPDQIKADITYLADDKLLGRMPGTPGFQMAGDYVISRLKSFHVAPAGDNGGWLQKLVLRKATNSPDAQISITRGGNSTNLTDGKDIALFPNPTTQQTTVDAPLVYAGYGITNAEQHYDDYKGLDVKGKIVVVISGAPASFPSSVVSHSTSLGTLQRTAAEHGAIGVIIARADSNARLSNIGKRGLYNAVDPQGKVLPSTTYASSQIKVLGLINYRTAASLFSNAGKDIATVLSDRKAGQSQSFPLNAQLKASYQTNFKDINTFNIVGKITGSDPVLKNEYVIHTAHLDHLGVGKPVEGDSIYNGAHDNASGVASLLQIANIYSHLKAKPKRSILIVMVTGEEMGDLGSGYFAQRPPVPVKDIVADVNTDMPAIIAPLLSVTALGAEHSSLQNQVNEAAAYLNISVEPDPEPKENRFVRSDQYSFVLQGIPALHIKYGNKTADGKNNLNEQVAKWRAKYYHQPQDDINGIFDFNAGKIYSQLNFLIGYLVANDPHRPTWNQGDIFAAKE